MYENDQSEFEACKLSLLDVILFASDLLQQSWTFSTVNDRYVFGLFAVCSAQ